MIRLSQLRMSTTLTRSDICAEVRRGNIKKMVFVIYDEQDLKRQYSRQISGYRYSGPQEVRWNIYEASFPPLLF